MEAFLKFDLSGKSKENYCFICLSQVSPQLNSVKVDPDEAIQPQPVLCAKPSLQYLFHYLKLTSRAKLDEREIPTCQKSQSLSGCGQVQFILCGECAVLNGRFSELFQQLERVQIEVASCLESIHRKLVQAKRTPSNTFLDQGEMTSLDLLRKKAAQKCSWKLKGTTPRVEVEKLANENLQKLRKAGRASPSRDLPGAAASVKIEMDTEEFSPVDLKLVNMRRRKRKPIILPSDIQANEGDSSNMSGNSSFELEVEGCVPELHGDDVDDLDDTSTTDNLSPRKKVNKNRIRFKQNPDTGKFKCSDCDKEFTRHDSARTHYRNFHLKLENLSCPTCGKWFSQKSHLETHHQTVHLKIKPYRCDECGKHFSQKSLLQRHRQAVHLRLKPHRCNECGREFGDRGNLQKHRRAVHLNRTGTDSETQPDTSTNDKILPISSDKTSWFKRNPTTNKLKCTACHKEFTKGFSANFHYRSIHLELTKVKCELCGKEFNRKGALKDHLRLIHRQTMSYSCDKCEGVQFTTWPELRTHRQEVHRKMEVNYRQCDKCGREFNTTWEFNLHQRRVHLKLKEFQCDKCGLKVRSRWALNQHSEAVHLGIKRHQCSQCGKSFSEAKDLRVHVDGVHLRIEHDCDKCGKQFSTRRCLLNHRKGVHPEEAANSTFK